MEGKTKIEKLNATREIFRNAIERTFGPLVLYAFIGGSSAFGFDGDTSDIDCIIVLKDKAYKDNHIQEKIKIFAKEYVEAHTTLGRKPDLDFPGDVITERQKESAIEGRGLITKERLIGISPINDDKDYDNDGADYIVWLTELALNNKMFLTGDAVAFEKDSLRAVDTISKFFIYLNDKLTFSGKDISNEALRKGDSFLGSSMSYGAEFDESVREKIKLSLGRLAKSNFIIKKGLLYKKNSESINDWAFNILNNICKKQILQLMPWEEIRSYLINEAIVK